MSVSKSRGFTKSFSRFSFRRLRKGAVGMGLLFGLVTYIQAVGLLQEFPETAQRLKLIASLKANSGLQVLYGSTDKLNGDVNTYVTWRALGILIIFGAIWAITATTRLLRADEESGRHELILAKRTTSVGALFISLKSIVYALIVQFLLAWLIVWSANTYKGVHIPVGSAALFSLVIVCAAAMFVGVAALCAQLFPTRRRAALVASGVLVMSFMLRALVNLSHDLSWLRYISPLNWFDSIQPLTEQNVAWFGPPVLVMAVTVGLSVYMNRRRDMGAGIIAQNELTKRSSSLLSSTFTSSLLFMRSSLLVWSLSLLAGATFLATLSQTAANALDGSTFQSSLTDITQGTTGDAVRLFQGLIFFVMILLVLLATISFVAGIRGEEASGRLDAILVRPPSRLRWLTERLGVIAVVIAGVSLAVGFLSWLVLPRAANISLNIMMQAGLNAAFPAALILGLGIFIFGLRPKLTSLVLYTLVGGSFLIEMIVPLIYPNSPLLNISLFHHVALAPATAVDWTQSGAMLAIGLLLGAAGVLLFNRRDLEEE